MNNFGRFQFALAIAFEDASGFVERLMFAQAGKGIGQESFGATGEEGRIGGEEWDFEMGGEITEEAVAFFLAPAEVPVKGDGDIAGVEAVAEFGGGGEEMGFGGVFEGFGGEDGMHSGKVDGLKVIHILFTMKSSDESGEVLVALA